MLVMWVEEVPRNQGPQAVSGAGKGRETDSSREAPGGTQPADTFL